MYQVEKTINLYQWIDGRKTKIKGTKQEIIRTLIENDAYEEYERERLNKKGRCC